MKPIKAIVKFLASGAIGAVVVLLVVGVLYLDRRPDLKIWHEPVLSEEFTTDSPVASFTDYLALEERLFAQLQAEVYDAVAPQDRTKINRYNRGSLSDPEIWPVNWNRSYELAEAPKAAVLLVHGMSDSPYSLRRMALSLNDAGAWVIGLRLPGNGTAPAGLLETRWQDMDRAIALALAHLRAEAGEVPLYIVGYSIGGALAVHSALTAREQPELPRLAGLVLISPAIGVTRLAALSVWQERLGHLLGLEKLAWNGIQLEYDPYKYGSFAINAATQVYLLTQEIQADLKRLSAAGQLGGLPPILAFQSAVDATVLPEAVIDALFGQLPMAGHELVLFDVNRRSEVGEVLRSDPKATIEALFAKPDLSFTLTLITNQPKTSLAVAQRRRLEGQSEVETEPLGLAWPNDIYSLSHVALPFSPDDPLYGEGALGDSPGIELGILALRGERGVLKISASDMLRLRWNPFYGYIEQRTLGFMGLADGE